MEHGGEHEETHPPRPSRRGLSTELVIVLVLSAVVAILVAVAGSAIVPADVEDVPVRTIRPIVDVEPEDLDPSNPLVLCEQFIDHRKCVREPT
jgi:hypothetical protein